MDLTHLAVQGAIEDAAWRLIELELRADELGETHPETGPLRDEAAMLRRRIDRLMTGEADEAEAEELAA
jgi:hypothetical protein